MFGRQPALDREVVQVAARPRDPRGRDGRRRRRGARLRSGEHLVQRHASHAERLGDGAVGDLAVVGVQAERQRVVVAAAPAASRCWPARRRTAASRWSARRSRCAAPRRACSPRSRRPSRAPGRSGRRAWSGGSPRSSRPGRSAMSTSTEPGFIRETSSLVTSVGALAPGTSTAPMTRSASRPRARSRRRWTTTRLHVALVDRRRPGAAGRCCVSSSVHLGLHAERDRPRRSARTTPRADDDDLGAAYTPDTPPRARRGRPGRACSVCAPTCGASRPATSDIGASSGSEPVGQLAPSRRRWR